MERFADIKRRLETLPGVATAQGWTPEEQAAAKRDYYDEIVAAAKNEKASREQLAVIDDVFFPGGQVQARKEPLRFLDYIARTFSESALPTVSMGLKLARGKYEEEIRPQAEARVKGAPTWTREKGWQESPFTPEDLARFIRERQAELREQRIAEEEPPTKAAALPGVLASMAGAALSPEFHALGGLAGKAIPLKYIARGAGKPLAESITRRLARLGLESGTWGTFSHQENILGQMAQGKGYAEAAKSPEALTAGAIGLAIPPVAVGAKAVFRGLLSRLRPKIEATPQKYVPIKEARESVAFAKSVEQNIKVSPPPPETLEVANKELIAKKVADRVRLASQVAVDETMQPGVSGEVPAKIKDLSLWRAIAGWPNAIARRFGVFRPVYEKAVSATNKIEHSEGATKRWMRQTWDGLAKDEKRQLGQIIINANLQEARFTSNQLLDAGYSPAIIDRYTRYANTMETVHRVLRRHRRDMAGAANLVKEREAIPAKLSKAQDGVEKLEEKLARFVAPEERVGNEKLIAKLQNQIARGEKRIERLGARKEQIGTILESTKVGYREGFFPHEHSGYVVNKNGVSIGSYATETEALKAAEALSAANPDAQVKYTPILFQWFGEKGTQLSTRSYGRLRGALEDALAVDVKEAGQLLKGVVRTPFRRRFWGHQLERTGVMGYSEEVEAVMESYLNTFARYVSLDDFKRTWLKTLEGVSAKSQPTLHQYIDRFGRSITGQKWEATSLFGAKEESIDNFLRGLPLIGKWIKTDYPTRELTQKIMSPVAHLKIGLLRPVSALLNESQFWLNSFPMLGPKWTGVGVARYAKLSPADAKLLERAGIRANVAKLDIRPLGVSAEGWKRSSMFLFNNRELANRGRHFLGQYYKSLAEGLKPGDALKAARAAVRTAHFEYGPIGRPVAFEDPALKLPLQFRTFLVNQLRLMSGRSEVKDPKVLAQMWGEFVLLTGALGIPGAEALNDLSKWAFRFSPLDMLKEKALKMGTAGQVALRGLPAAAGVDLSRSLGMGDIIPSLRWSELAGPAAGTAIDIASILARRDWTDEVDLLNDIGGAITPVAGRPVQALRAALKGGIVEGRRGRPRYVATTREMATMGLGLRTLMDANEADAAGMSNRMAENFKRESGRIIDNLIRAVEQDNQKKIDKGIKAYERMLKRYDATESRETFNAKLKNAWRQRQMMEGERILRQQPKGLRRRAAETFEAVEAGRE